MKRLYRRIAIALAVATLLFAAYTFAFENYVSIDTDYVDLEEPVVITYQDLLSDEEGFFNQLYMLLLNEKAADEYINYEKAAIFSMIGGIVLIIIGLFVFIKNDKYVILTGGIALNCIAGFILRTIVDEAEKAVSSSLLGSLEMIFGKAIKFDSDIGTFLIVSLVLAVGFAICLVKYYNTTESTGSAGNDSLNEKQNEMKEEV